MIMGIGDWGFGLWPHTQKPKPQNPNPKTQKPKKIIFLLNIIKKYFIFIK